MNNAHSYSLVRPKRFAFNPSQLIVLFTILLSICAFFGSGSASLGQTPQPSASQFEGSLDKVEMSTLGGWAWDASRPNSPIKVDIYDGEKLLATITAETLRADLKAAQKGDGKHGFDFSLPQSLRNSESHTISVKYSGTDTNLPGSPKTLLSPKP